MLAWFTSISSAALITTAALGEPPVFSQAGFEADRAAATESNRLHLVYATASWCPPCQQMKKTTWVDDTVVSWLESRAVVTPLDVDAFPSKSAELRVRAMPTMILFAGERELSRAVGYRSADQLASWLEASAPAMPAPSEEAEDVPAGAPADEAVVEESADSGTAALDPSRPIRPQLAARAAAMETYLDLEVEIQALRALSAEGAHAMAAEGLMWLFENERRMVRRKDDARIEFLAPAMREVAEAHPHTAERLTSQRDAITRALAAVDARSLQKWALLCSATGGDDTMADALAALLAERAPTPALRTASGSFVSMLGEQGRYDLLAQLISPSRYADSLAQSARRFPATTDAEAGIRRARLAAAYGAALSTNDTPAAQAVAETTHALDPSPEARAALAQAAEATDRDPVGLDVFLVE
ncbi:MAG: thioredoxin domain-containing protein [Planctomycetota bacterium]